MILLGLIYLTACDSEKNVVHNTPPEIDIISHDNGSEVFEGYPVEFRAILSDINHDIGELSARWNVNGKEVCPFLPPEQNGETVCVAKINQGDEEIIVEVKDAENVSVTDTIYLSIIPTEAPSATIIQPEGTGIFYSDHPIIFRGMIGDVEDNVSELLYEWSSSVDGTLDVQETFENNGTIGGNVFLTEGIHTITLFVEDRTEKTDATDVTITVGGPNTAPTCEITTPSTNSASAIGEVITFTGVVNDVDIPASMLSVSWSSDKMDEVIGSSTPTTSGEVLFSYADLPIDSHSMIMTVTDEKGATCSDFIQVTVGTPPFVTIDSPISGTYNEGEAITFSATISDNEDQPDELSLEWTTSDGTVLNTQSATPVGNVEFVLNDIPYGQQLVTLTATDTDGLMASDLVSFTINALPTQPSLTVLPVNPKTSDDLTATATGSTDVDDGGNLHYFYEWASGATIHGGMILSHLDTEKGQQWTITATPNDGFGNGPSVTQIVTIQNTPPVDLVLTVDPETEIYNDGTFTCSATADDIDTGDELEFSYEWSIGATTETISLDGSLNPTDILTCSSTVSDGTDIVLGSRSVTLENRAPILSGLTIDFDGDLWNGTTLHCSVDVTDPDGETVEVNYTWLLADGTTTVEGDSYTLENVADGDIFTCFATVDDNYGGNASIEGEISIVNTPPIVDSISIVPDSVVPAEHTFTCNVEASDFNEDDILVNYSWMIDGILQEEASNTLRGYFSLGMVITCVATPNDGKIDGNEYTDEVVVTNALPIIDSVVLSPSHVFTNDTIIADVVISDTDTSQINALHPRYSWHVVDIDGNDVEVQVGTDNTLNGVSHFERDEEVYVVVTPNDGVEDGLEEISSSLIILNSEPSEPNIVLSPEQPLAGLDDLTCESISTDDDTDEIIYSYVWMGPEGNIQQTTETSENTDLFLASGTREGNWTCEVTAYDGTDYGPSHSSDLTLENNCVSLEFDGGSDSVTLGSPLQTSYEDITLAMWIQPSSTLLNSSSDSNLGLLSQWNETLQSGWKLSYRSINGEKGLEFLFDNALIEYRGWELQPDVWYRIAVVKSGTQASLYIDDVLVGLGTVGQSSFSTGDLNVGYLSGQSNSSFEGLISRVTIWESPLSTTDMSTYWNNFDFGYPILDYTVGRDSFVNDSSGNGNNGILVETVWIEICPEEDLDDDGISAWEDCDDLVNTLGSYFVDQDCDGVDGRQEIVVIGLPNTFNSGGLDIPSQAATNATLSRTSINTSSSSANTWSTSMYIRRRTDGTITEVGLGLGGGYVDFSGGFSNEFSGGSANGWQKILDWLGTEKTLTQDFFNDGITSTLNLTRSGTDVIVSTDNSTYLDIPTSGTLFSINGGTCESKGPGQGVDNCGGSFTLDFYVGTHITVSPNITPFQPTQVRDPATWSIDLDGNGSVLNGVTNRPWSENIGVESALSEIFAAIVVANPDINLFNNGIYTIDGYTYMEIQTGINSNIVDANFTTTNNNGTNISPYVTSIDGE